MAPGMAGVFVCLNRLFLCFCNVICCFFCRNAGTTSRIEEKVMGKFSILIPFLLGWMDVQVVQSSLAAPALRQKRLFPASVAK